MLLGLINARYPVVKENKADSSSYADFGPALIAELTGQQPITGNKGRSDAFGARMKLHPDSYLPDISRHRPTAFIRKE